MLQKGTKASIYYTALISITTNLVLLFIFAAIIMWVEVKLDFIPDLSYFENFWMLLGLDIICSVIGRAFK
jgi:hypothetical protein